MSASGDLRSINCTNCGAGLPVLGGGRVTTQICGYCGASLDATDNFRVLDVYANMERPETPFQLGMTGEIDGVEFTITGIKGMVEPGYGAWVDHMLYSPTHGYAWLTLEDGHCVFSRKVRDQPSAWLTAAQVELAENRPSRRFRAHNYSYYETTNWIVDYVEGAFNYRPKKGDRGTTVSMANWSGGKPRFLSLLEPDAEGGEREVEISHYADDAPEAFGLPPLEGEGVHPLQTYTPAKNKGFYRLWWGAMTVASIVLLVTILNVRGGYETLVGSRLSPEPTLAKFEVTDTARPVRLRLTTDIDNSWAEFPLRVVGPDGAPVADTAFVVQYYWGYSDGERWSEGSQSDVVSFMAPSEGLYRLELLPGEGEAVTNSRMSTFSLEARQSVMTIGWPITLIVIFSILFAFSFASKLIFSARRSSGSDWSDED